jgi:hypothetical protein
MLLVVHAILAWIKELSTKDEFWNSADKMFHAYYDDICKKNKQD